MKITKIEYKIHRAKPVVSFKIALMDQATTDTVVLRAETDNGLVGYGEACPFMPVTGETTATVCAYLDLLIPKLIGKSPLEMEEIHRIMDRLMIGQTAAKAGIDIAMYDIAAKAAKLPLYKYLGASTNQVHSDITIGIDEPTKMAELARKYVDAGFTILKIKVGINPVNDVEAIRLIREAVGDEIELRLDANQGWSKKQARSVLQELSRYGVEEIEQPVHFQDLVAMRYLVEHADQTIMADESVHSPKDAIRMISNDACDMINIKLMKSAGIYPALLINGIAEAAGMACMVGCMSETRIGISAAAAFTASRRNILYADLDSHHLIAEDPKIRGGFTQKGGLITLTEAHGLGLEIDYEEID